MQDDLYKDKARILKWRGEGGEESGNQTVTKKQEYYKLDSLKRFFTIIIYFFLL